MIKVHIVKSNFLGVKAKNIMFGVMATKIMRIKQMAGKYPSYPEGRSIH